MISVILGFLLLVITVEMLMGLLDGGESRLGRVLWAAIFNVLDLCKKNKKTVSAVFALLALYIFAFLVFFLRTLPSLDLEFREPLYPKNQLYISDEIFYIQTLGNCAPYSVMGIIYMLRGERVNPEMLARQTRWRMIGNSTFPQGLIGLLHRHNIKTREYSLRAYGDDKKILWIKNQIDNGTPVIILVRVKNIQHYLTVVGYDENGFMLYDSDQERHGENTNKTIVDNEDYAGNRYYTNEELNYLWDKGGFAVFFRNWAVVCSL